MPLQSSGTITLAQIGSEFNDSQPHSLSEFYVGGSAGVTSGGAPNVPSSGTISMSQFYDAANQVTVTISSGATNQNVSTLFGSNFSSAIPKVLVINSGVELGATSLSNYALQVPSGMGGTLNIQNAGTISGAGGDGSSSGSGGDGGTALFIASSNVTVTNTGTIRGGGGGGGRGADGVQGGCANPVGAIFCCSGPAGTGGAGGNGQGYDQSQSNGSGGSAAGTGSQGHPLCYTFFGPGGYNASTAGGNGGNGGTYGNNGAAGGNTGAGNGSSGGNAGKYIQLSGVSYSLSNSGTLQGNAP